MCQNLKKFSKITAKIVCLSFVVELLLVSTAAATDFSSTNFILRDPVITPSGGLSTSTSFQQLGSTGQPAIGESTSTSFILRSGFDYFPTTALSGLTQDRYRWYDNIDALQPVNPRSSENTKITISTGDNMRLRLGLKATTEPFPSASIFKLQFADRGNIATCAAIPTASFVDVGPASSSAAVWVGFDNLGVADGAQISSTLLTASAGTGGSRQTYQENNNTAATPAVISVGTNADGEWDWSLKYRGTNNGLDYCFRMVTSTGSLLGNYAVYPTVTIVTPVPSSGGGGGGGSGGYSTIIPSSSTDVPAVPAATPQAVTSTTQAATQAVTPAASTKTEVVFSGKAYPGSKVTLLKDGAKAGVFTASPNGDFTISLADINAGKYNFNLYTEDSKSLKSSSFAKVVEVVKDQSTKIEKITIAPTVQINKSSVKRDEAVLVSGQTYPFGKVTIVFGGKNKITIQKQADENGRYSHSFDSGLVAKGDYDVKVSSGTSVLSQPATFKVGSKTVLTVDKAVLKGDLNGDGVVNILDFSILGFWYGKSAPTDSKKLASFRAADLNGDGVVDMKDASILAANWTG